MKEFKSYTKHQYDLDIVSTCRSALTALKKHGGSTNIDRAQLRKVAELQITSLGFDPKEMFRHKHPVVLQRSAGSGTFYWWLSLALAVEKPSLIGLRLNHFLKFEKDHEVEFLNNVEFTVLDIMLQFDLPDAANAVNMVTDWINSKFKQLGNVRQIAKTRKRRNDKNPFKPEYLPIISRELECHVAGFDTPENGNTYDCSHLILRALLGYQLEQKLLLDINQADLGRKFLEYAEIGYIQPNGKLSAYRILQNNFKYRNDNGEYCEITNTLYKKYLAE